MDMYLNLTLRDTVENIFPITKTTITRFIY